ncbi:T9SS type A sorting domain-containing protein [Bacteroidota bacterium]
MKRKFVLLFLILFIKIAAAQTILPDVVASSGNYFANGLVSISWTVGELFIETQASTSIILTQGFQQPLYSIVSIDEAADPSIEFIIYPNPASKYLVIHASNESIYEMKVNIFNLQGNQVFSGNIVDAETSINLSDLTEGVYIITITSITQATISNYKLIKYN